MSDFNWCHGPECHTKHTLDRVRGTKGSKVLRTRKIKTNNYWNAKSSWNYFCSHHCQQDFWNEYGPQIRAIAPRTEALETPIENPERTKHTTSYGYTYYDTKITEVRQD